MAESGPGRAEATDPVASDRTLGELVADANSGVSELVRLQIELAKAEIGHDVRHVARGSALFVAAAFIAHLVLILASVTVGLVLWEFWLPAWASFLIVTGAYLLIAVIMIVGGMILFRRRKGTAFTRHTLPRTLSLLRPGRRDEQPDSVAAAGEHPGLTGA